jgi:hypothetical protein
MTYTYALEPRGRWHSRRHKKDSTPHIFESLQRNRNTGDGLQIRFKPFATTAQICMTTA